MKARKKWLLPALVILAAAILVVTLLRAFDTKMIVRRYEIKSEKVAEDVRIVLLTDYHCCDYGEGQRELLDAVTAQSPDLVLLAGDILDDTARSWERAYALTRALSAEYPTYYVSGNHEYWSGKAEEIKTAMEDCGAVILEGETQLLDMGGQSLMLCGVDDPDVGEQEWRRQLEQVSASAAGKEFSILLTHRPERAEDYTGRGFDLVVAGHAHGGQWRLPGIINGLYGPHQGWFPKYAGGRYSLDDSTTMIVSRGLARETSRIPRIFNPPELVVIDIRTP